MFGQVINFLTDNQLLIRKSLDSALFIIRQDYVLRDTSNRHPTEYGREKNEYFGRTYTFAVLSDYKLWCDAKIQTPWLYDSNYLQLGQIDSIRPVLSKIANRPLYLAIGDQFKHLLVAGADLLNDYRQVLDAFLGQRPGQCSWPSGGKEAAESYNRTVRYVIDGRGRGGICFIHSSSPEM